MRVARRIPLFVLIIAHGASAQSGPQRPLVAMWVETPAIVSVPPGAVVAWSIYANVWSPAITTFGLAGISVDFVQDSANPSGLVMNPAPTVPEAMAGFSRPAGISNPGPGGAGSGYGGTAVPNPQHAGAFDLREIGGVQNTFAVGVGTMGQDRVVEIGLGQQTTAQLVATGVLTMPNTYGRYVFRLENGHATVLTKVGTPSVASSTIWALPSLGPDISVTVRCPADLDGGSGNGVPDGGVDVSDLVYFLDGYQLGNVAVDLDDGSMTGTPDGAVDLNDLLFFLSHYEPGC